MLSGLPQRIVGVARGDGSLHRFRQAVVLVVGIARGIGRAVERLLLRGKIVVVVIAPRDAVGIPAASLYRLYALKIAAFAINQHNTIF